MESDVLGSEGNYARGGGVFGERSGSAGAGIWLLALAETAVQSIAGVSVAAGVPAVGLRTVMVATSAAEIVQQFGSGAGAL